VCGLVKKVGILNRLLPDPQRACSTMKCPLCPTLHHPGEALVASLSKFEGDRDECARDIQHGCRILEYSRALLNGV
jgi:hypothetical protein